MLDYPLWKKILVSVVCAWGILISLPNFLPTNNVFDNMPSWLPGKTVNLGLDLQGGAHLLLELQIEKIFEARLASTETELRRSFRENRIRAHSFLIDQQTLGFTLANAGDISKTIDIARDINPNLLLDQNNGRITLEFNEPTKLDIQTQALNQSIEVVRRRVDEFGTNEPLIQRQGENRILVQVPGIQDSSALKALLNTTARLTFHLVQDTVSADRVDQIAPKADQVILPDQSNPNRYLVMERTPFVGGEDLENAQSTFDNGQAVVSITFNASGGRAFGEMTRTNVGGFLAIVLDDQVISAPRVNEPILTGSSLISGNFTLETAEELAVLLRAGALPAPLIYIEERTVGPGLGADSIQAGRIAAIIGIIAVSIFMIASYKRFGIYAVCALISNMLLILAVITALQITLTLPGIAGLVLTIGMAVDANVLIFERIREELNLRNNVSNAIDTGYRQAFSTIIDSNLTTLIGAILLFSFGSGPLKGFALTLSIGILSSMFTAIMVTRWFVLSWLRRTRPKTIHI
ncbi:MAG: protein translocase subunit SecD [Alphaproteobacteria bacterium]